MFAGLETLESRQMLTPLVNHAPVLNASYSPTVATVLEDSGVPSGTVGTLVSSLVNLGNVSDSDASPLSGIAVTDMEDWDGSWYYSTSGGESWSSISFVDSSESLLLAADANTRVYFKPNSNYEGTARFTFRAWDRTSGSNGGYVDTTTNGGATAYSSATDTARAIVTGINDAPSSDDFTINPDLDSTLLEDNDYVFSDSDFPFHDPNDDYSGNWIGGIRIVSTPGSGWLTNGDSEVSVGDTISSDDLYYGAFIYHPDGNGHGEDYASFQFRMIDDGDTSNGGVNIAAAANTVTINVTSVADAPIGTDNAINGELDDTLVENGSYAFKAADFGFTDPDDSPADSFAGVDIVSLPYSGRLIYNGVLLGADNLPYFTSAGDFGDGFLTYFPNEGYSNDVEGPDTFTFKVKDNRNSSETYGSDIDATARTMTLNITPYTPEIPEVLPPDYVSSVQIDANSANVTPGQRVFATVSYQNTKETKSNPKSIKIYRSSDGTLDHRDRLLASAILPGVRPHEGIVLPMSWIASVGDSAADESNDGTTSSFLLAIVDEESMTGDVTLPNSWNATDSALYTVTVPNITISHTSVLDATEGVSNSGKFVLTRSGDTSLPLTTYYQWNSTDADYATNAADFGGAFPGHETATPGRFSVTFLPGYSSASIDVTPVIDINGNANEHLTESLTLSLVNDPATLDSYTVDIGGEGKDAVAVMDIHDIINTVSIKSTDATASEKRTQTASFRLSRGTGESNKLPLVVDVDFLGSATPEGSASDYEVRVGGKLVEIGEGRGALTIPANKNFVDFKLTPIDDKRIEGPETVIPTIAADETNYSYVRGAAFSASATIADNDDLRLSTEITAGAQSFAAPTNQGAKFLRFTVTVTNSSTERSAATNLQVGVLVGDATVGNYNSANFIQLGVVVLPGIGAGATFTKTFNISLRNQNPLSAGSYRIVAKADAMNAINETNENDNYAFSAPIVTVTSDHLPG